jgi:hypothetical protein
MLLKRDAKNPHAKNMASFVKYNEDTFISLAPYIYTGDGTLMTIQASAVKLVKRMKAKYPSSNDVSTDDIRRGSTRIHEEMDCESKETHEESSYVEHLNFNAGAVVVNFIDEIPICGFTILQGYHLHMSPFLDLLSDSSARWWRCWNELADSIIRNAPRLETSLQRMTAFRWNADRNKVAASVMSPLMLFSGLPQGNMVRKRHSATGVHIPTSPNPRFAAAGISVSNTPALRSSVATAGWPVVILLYRLVSAFTKTDRTQVQSAIDRVANVSIEGRQYAESLILKQKTKDSVRLPSNDIISKPFGNFNDVKYLSTVSQRPHTQLELSSSCDYNNTILILSVPCNLSTMIRIGLQLLSEELLISMNDLRRTGSVKYDKKEYTRSVDIGKVELMCMGPPPSQPCYDLNSNLISAPHIDITKPVSYMRFSDRSRACHSSV